MGLITQALLNESEKGVSIWLKNKNEDGLVTSAKKVSKAKQIYYILMRYYKE